MQIGPPEPLPDAIPDRLFPGLQSVDPWVTGWAVGKSCAVTMCDGSERPRVSITIVDRFSTSWRAHFASLDFAIRAADIAEIVPSAHALPAPFTSKMMEAGEFRMGTYRYGVETVAGEKVILYGSNALWLLDSLRTSDIADVFHPRYPDRYPRGDAIPRYKRCQISTPQTEEADRQLYERHFADHGPAQERLKGSRATYTAHRYADQFPLRERPLALAAAWDRLRTGVSRYERFEGDDIDVLARFAARVGHCVVPEGHIEAGRELNFSYLVWLTINGKIPANHRRRLESIAG